VVVTVSSLGAMNSLGAGGAQTPWLINGANALTFGLMVITATLTPVLIRFLGVKWSLFFGAAGYAPYAAALYCNIVSSWDDRPTAGDQDLSQSLLSY